MNIDEIYRKYSKLNPNLGINLSKKKLKDKSHTVPGWIIGESEDKVLSGRELSDLFKTLGINKQIFYDLVILNISSIDDRPKCSVCGKECRFNSFKYSDKCEEHHIIKQFSEETRRKLSESMKGNSNPKGIKRSEEFKRRLSEVNKGNTNFKGRHHTEETRKKMSIVQTGLKRSEEARKNISLGKIKYIEEHPEELDRFMSLSVSQVHKSGYIHLNKCELDLFYRSSWEEHFMIFCDNSEEVKKIVKPFTIRYEYNGRIKLYYPDLMVELASGDIVIIEIKPLGKVSEDLVQAKKLAAERYCLDKDNYHYRILTQREVFDKNFTFKNLINNDPLY